MSVMPFRFTPPGRSPSDIFLELWLEAADWTSAQSTNSETPRQAFCDAIDRALTLRNIDETSAALDALRKPTGLSPSQWRGRVLAIMDRIDRMFLAIHPRTLNLAPTDPAKVAIPPWLKRLQAWRTHSQGWYAENDGYRLVARGPLTRREREPAAASADSLLDRFAALTVVSRTFTDYRTGRISVAQRVYDTSATYGVDPIPELGEEKIAFIPVMQTRDEVVLTSMTRHDRAFVQCGPSRTVDAAQRIHDALSGELDIAIAVAPEFSVTNEQSTQLKRLLRTSARKLASLVVAGSGETDEREEDLPWNEAKVLSSTGKTLWAQRKLWPAAVRQKRAIEWGLPDPADGMVYENTASGRELLVVDIDDLGRCVILICQDLVNRPLAPEVVRQFQPDWVISPILDGGLSIGRWAHAAAFTMSYDSRTRFLISCCTGLIAPPRIPLKAPHCGLVVGPCDGDADDEGRMVAGADAAGTPQRAVVTWRNGGPEWTRTALVEWDAS